MVLVIAKKVVGYLLDTILQMKIGCLITWLQILDKNKKNKKKIYAVSPGYNITFRGPVNVVHYKNNQKNLHYVKEKGA